MNYIYKTVIVSGIACLIAGEAAAQTTWDVSLWGMRRAFTEHVHMLSELVEERTNGEFKLNISYGGLSKPSENLDGVSFGAFEMAMVCPFNHPAKLPTFNVMDLPFLGISSVEQQGASDAIMLENPILRRDLARWNAVPVMPSPQSQYNLVGRGDALDTLAGFQGMRIRANGVMALALAKLGAVPTPIPSTEVYSSLDAGVVDAVAFADHAQLAFGLAEAGDWWTTNLNPGTGTCPIVANVDAVDSLSNENRQILFAAVPEAMEHYYASYDEAVKEWRKTAEDSGLKLITFSEDQLADIRELVLPIHEEWITQVTSQGHDGQALYDAMVAAVSATSK
jgi:TRAP-type C4-dicarboxylate transport system substrate-binding protein